MLILFRQLLYIRKIVFRNLLYYIQYENILDFENCTHIVLNPRYGGVHIFGCRRRPFKICTHFKTHGGVRTPPFPITKIKACTQTNKFYYNPPTRPNKFSYPTPYSNIMSCSIKNISIIVKYLSFLEIL